jgi:hypothetical protein
MRKIVVVAVVLFVVVFLILCSSEKKASPNDMNKIAEKFVKLAFYVSEFDGDYVDAYFGPKKLKDEALGRKYSLKKIKTKAGSLIVQLEKMNLQDFEDNLSKHRYKYMLEMLKSLSAWADHLSGSKMSFDEESKAVYGIVSPHNPPEFFDEVLCELDELLPGKGSSKSLSDRFNEYRKQFMIPPDKVDAVFKAAIEEGRKRTRENLSLPDNENFVLEYVKGKSWGAYNWFKGNGQSLIQINLDLPIYIDRALDLACHEGYPGHHAFYSMVEKTLYREKGWVEFSIYPLFSPQSLISEGTANYGIEVAFPYEERIKFEKEVLYPLAGLNPKEAENYYHVLKVWGKLTYARNEAARQYLDGKIDRNKFIQWLVSYQLRSQQGAEKSLNFVEKYRTYIINYNLGYDMVKNYIEKRVDPKKDPQKIWDEFKKLLTIPVMPSDLE